MREHPDARQKIDDARKKRYLSGIDAAYRAALRRATGRALTKMKAIYPEEYEEFRPQMSRRDALIAIRDRHRRIFEDLLDSERLVEGIPRARRRTDEEEIPIHLKYEPHGEF